MGIVSGMFGGAGAALQDIGATRMKADLLRENESALLDKKAGIDAKAADTRGRVELQRQMALEQFKSTLAERTRTDQLGRIDKAAAPIIGGIVTRKANKFYAEQGGPSDHTIDDLSDEEKAEFRPTDMEAIDARIQAGVTTGDVDPIKAKGALQKDDSALYKVQLEQLKEEGRDRRSEDAIRRAEIAAESRERIAAAGNASRERSAEIRVAAMVKAAGGGSSGNKETLSFIDGQRKDIASEAQDLRARYQAELRDASSKRRAEIEATYAPKFAELESRRTQIQADFDSLREKVGLPKAAAPAAAPAPNPAAPPPLPTPGKPAASGSRASQFRVIR